jgi:hypothetical protein
VAQTSLIGNWAWMMGVILTTFYIVLYWYPEYLGLNQDGGNSTGIVGFDPLSYILNGKAASQWFVYTLYTIVVGLFIKYFKIPSYQLVRTLSVMFFNWDLLF